MPKPSSSFHNVKVIEMANTKVAKVKNKVPYGTQSVPYLILTPAQMYEVGIRVAEHDVTDAFC